MSKQTQTATAARARRNVPAARRQTAAPRIEWSIPLGRTNLLILAVGIVLIVIGYVLMGSVTANTAINPKWNEPAAVTIAPILLGLGYCVAIPLAILWRPKRVDETTDQEDA